MPHKLNQSVPEPAREEQPASVRLRLSTADVPEANRLAIWRDVISKHLFNADVKPYDDMPLKGEANILPLGDCAVSTIVSSRAQYYVASNYLRNARDLINIIIAKRGRLHGRQRSNGVTIGPGEAFAILATETCFVDILEDSEAFNISLPASALEPLVPDLGHVIARPLNSNPSALTLLDAYATVLQSVEAPINTATAATTSLHLIELASNVLVSTAESLPVNDRRGIRETRRQSIKKEIVANLTRHDLSPDLIAERLGITARYLRKLLHEEGTSFSDFLRQTRLERAFLLLNDRQQDHRSISEIAYQVGFNDLSYFNRCFRRQYGITPSDLRIGSTPSHRSSRWNGAHGYWPAGQPLNYSQPDFLKRQ